MSLQLINTYTLKLFSILIWLRNHYYQYNWSDNICQQGLACKKSEKNVKKEGEKAVESEKKVET